MLNIILVSTRQETLRPFIKALQVEQDVGLGLENNAGSVLEHVRNQAPQLLIIDSHLDEMDPLDLAVELLKINALVNIAMISSMEEETFHETTEGLGLLPRIPSPPTAADAALLLSRLRDMPGLV